MKMYVFLFTSFVVLILCGQCSAEIRNFHTESSYIMSRNEPIKDAQEIAFKYAIRKISEEVGIIIKSFSSVKDSALTEDEIETLTATVLRIKSKNFGKNITADGNLEISVKVDAEIDTDHAAKLLTELAELHKSTEDYNECLADYVKRQEQFNTISGEYLGSYQKQIMRTIRDGCKLQNDGKFNEALKVYDEAIERGTELSVVYIKRGHIYNLQDKKNLATADFEKAIALNNDSVGVHYAKAVLLENQGKFILALNEYRSFIKEAGIVYYDTEIVDALNKIVELEELN